MSRLRLALLEALRVVQRDARSVRSLFDRLTSGSAWRILASLLAPALMVTASLARAATPVIVAYVFPQGKILSAADVDAHSLSRINYAFANIADGRIIEGFAPETQNLATLVSLKHDNPSLTVLVSVGGWLWSGNFSDVALTKQSRSVFVDSVVAYLAAHNLDGLDVDWEYPGMAGAGHVFRAEDKQNYTLLLKDLRVRFRKEEARQHRHLYLTVAAGASQEFLDHTEISRVELYVDTINLMAYDYYEPGSDKITGNHAPLFTDPADPKKVSADTSVRAYEQAGVPAHKLVLGVPFYGHVWGQVQALQHGLFQPGSPVPSAYANYESLRTAMLDRGYLQLWDEAASAPYLYNPGTQIFISYDDPRSLALKAGYVLNHHLAGMMFWEYSNDPSGTLLGALNVALHAAHAQAIR